MRTGAGAAFHAVDVNRIGPGFCSHAHVIVDACRTQLELNRDLPIGGFAHFLDLEREIVRPHPVRVTRR